MDEVNLKASALESEDWNILCVKLQKRFDEVNVNTIRKSKTEVTDEKTDATTATDATTQSTDASTAA